MNNKNRVAMFNILSTVLLNGISIFTAPLFSRMLGTSGYGVLTTYTTWTSIVSIVFTLSVSSSIANSRASFPEEKWNEYQASIMGLMCTSFACFSALMLIFIVPVSQLMSLDQRLIPLMLIHSFGNSSLGFVTARFSYEFKAGRNFTISIAVTLLTIALSLVLIPRFPADSNYLGRVWALALIYGCFGFVSCCYVFGRGKMFYNKRYWKFCLPIAIPFIFHCLSDLLLGHSDLLMLKKLGTSSMAGLYGLAYNFSAILYTLWTSLNNSWSPFYYEYMRTEQDDVLRKTAKNYAELFTVLACGFVLLQPEVYKIFASEEFHPGGVLIPLFVVSHYSVFFTGLCVNFEAFHRRTDIMATGTIMACVLNIVLNYFWIQSMGILGAALATMISHALQATYHQIMVRRVSKEKKFPIYLSILLPYMGLFLAVVLLGNVTAGLWWVRWPLGAVLGIWELRRVFQRKAIF